MNQKAKLQVATILCPAASLLVVCALGSLGNSRARGLEVDTATLHQQIVAAKQLLVEVEGQKHFVRFPTAEQAPQEQPAFLNQLRAYADLNRVRINRWAVTAAPPHNTDAQRRPLPPDVIPLSSALEVSGRFADVRMFLYDLLRSPRLVNMADMRWTRALPGCVTTLSFMLTRYVVPPGKATNDMSTAVAAMPADTSRVAPDRAVRTAATTARGRPLPTAHESSSARRLQNNPLFALVLSASATRASRPERLPRLRRGGVE